LSVLQGDVDCDGRVAGSDALALLRHLSDLSYNRFGGCPDIGTGILTFGDTDCSGSLDNNDLLRVLKFSGGIAVQAGSGCTPMGQPIDSN
jgi:hypothetical protein